ncbi:uncharacterized protein EI90DRAFT_366493 [Cantharellus anzutake]|uniref:uncharacterized protein n=1 Tax=Cantharellus anzutake TaxID=1750568 RepID=UPI0019073048|nr:uncharacterized protein EI90DRAFT_366493 [Cantharellus anzutake]KAF8315083.1 hypothetical protein EI90DRAFT_366493 [Cantharellus anzutake]
MAAALVSVILSQSIYAAPLSQHPPPNNTAFSINYSDACNDLRNCRTMWSMVYSCLLTIFACIWTAIHPDVPKQYSAWSLRFKSRNIQMMWTLVSPEVIVAAAWDEFSEAWRISKRSDIDFSQGWTFTHSYFVIMGGFVDSSKREAVIPTQDEDPSTLFEKYPGVIDKSGDHRKVAVTKEQILDRSKGDFFAKSIVVLQLLWFTTQYVGRWASHLPRSQLEAMTLAYAALSILVCALWWYKPLDVHFPIHVTEETQTIPSNPDVITDQVLPKTGTGDAANPSSSTAKILETNPLWILGVTGVIFGGIHCLAWPFPFPTRAEKLLWRISAIIITVGPGPLAWAMEKQERDEGISAFLLGLSMLFYPIARIILFTVLARPTTGRGPWIELKINTIELISSLRQLPEAVGTGCWSCQYSTLTFMSLRSPPPGLYRTTSWMSFIPHLG